MDSGKTLKRFKPGSDMIRLAFLKTHFGCCVENSLEVSQSGCRETIKREMKAWIRIVAEGME